MKHYAHDSHVKILGTKINAISLNAAVAAGLVKASYNRVWSAIQNGKIHLNKIGRQWVVNPEEIAWLNNYFGKIDEARRLRDEEHLARIQRRLDKDA